MMRGASYAACDLPNCPPRTTRAGGFYVPRGYRTRAARRTRPAISQTARRERLAPGGFTYPEVIEPLFCRWYLA